MSIIEKEGNKEKEKIYKLDTPRSYLIFKQSTREKPTVDERSL